MTVGHERCGLAVPSDLGHGQLAAGRPVGVVGGEGDDAAFDPDDDGVEAAVCEVGADDGDVVAALGDAGGGRVVADEVQLDRGVALAPVPLQRGDAWAAMPEAKLRIGWKFVKRSQ